jgi:hypothetical protein
MSLLNNPLHVLLRSKATTSPVRKLHSHLALVATDNGADMKHHLGCNRSGVDPEGLMSQFIRSVPCPSERWSWRTFHPTTVPVANMLLTNSNESHLAWIVI